jgi:AcrR family transcriptional regulator
LSEKLRAHSDADKHLKYLKIIDVASRLLVQERILQTTARIAQEAQIAKGTLYLYFKTKEEIYMSVLVEQFRRWQRQLRDYILDENPTFEGFVQHLCQSLADYSIFLDLVSRSAYILEENLSIDFLRRSRLMMRQENVRTAQLLGKQFHTMKLSEAECLQRLRRFYTYAIAFWSECFPSSLTVQALPEDFANVKEQTKKYFCEICFMSHLIWTAPLVHDFSLEV